MKLLHILNGDSTRMTIEHSGVPGRFVSWSDVLHEGPTPYGVSDVEWRRIRAGHLASLGFDTADVETQYAAEHDALETWPAYDEVVFWFEHDLYDQLILIRHLDWLSKIADRGGTRFSLVCGSRYLGCLESTEFPPLFEARQPITDDQIQLGIRAWRAFRDNDPTGLEPFAASSSEALPFLAGAIRRHLEDFPSRENGLSRSESQILRTMEQGESVPAGVFAATSRLEERIFMGDVTFWAIVRRLASAPHPLIALNTQPRSEALPTGSMQLTDAAHDVLEGRADHIALNGIDRWMGGAHLTTSHYWRWTGQNLVKAEG